MRLSMIFSISALTLVTACSTVPKTDTLMTGIDMKAAAPATAPGTKLAATDPTCKTFYNNVSDAAIEAEKAKRTNKQAASTGVSILTSVIGLGPLGSIATSSAAQIALSQTGSDVSTVVFDPEKSFDKRVIETADKVNCPVRVKTPTPAKTTTTP